MNKSNVFNNAPRINIRRSSSKASSSLLFFILSFSLLSQWIRWLPVYLSAVTFPHCDSVCSFVPFTPLCETCGNSSYALSQSTDQSTFADNFVTISETSELSNENHAYEDVSIDLIKVVKGRHVYTEAQCRQCHACRETSHSTYSNLMDGICMNTRQYGMITGLGFSITFAIFGLFAGFLVDIKSDRGGTILGISMLCCGLITLLTAFAQGFYHVLVLRSLLGAVQAFSAPACIYIITSYFTETSARVGANAAYTIGVYLGAGLSSLSMIFSQYYGWRFCLEFVGYTTMIISLMYEFLVDVDIFQLYRQRKRKDSHSILSFESMLAASPSYTYGERNPLLYDPHDTYDRGYIETSRNEDPESYQSIYAEESCDVSEGGDHGDPDDLFTNPTQDFTLAAHDTIVKDISMDSLSNLLSDEYVPGRVNRTTHNNYAYTSSDTSPTRESIISNLTNDSAFDNPIGSFSPTFAANRDPNPSSRRIHSNSIFFSPDNDHRIPSMNNASFCESLDNMPLEEVTMGDMLYAFFCRGQIPYGLPILLMASGFRFMAGIVIFTYIPVLMARKFPEHAQAFSVLNALILLCCGSLSSVVGGRIGQGAFKRSGLIGLVQIATASCALSIVPFILAIGSQTFWFSLTCLAVAYLFGEAWMSVSLALLQSLSSKRTQGLAMASYLFVNWLASAINVEVVGWMDPGTVGLSRNLSMNILVMVSISCCLFISLGFILRNYEFKPASHSKELRLSAIDLMEEDIR